MNYIETFFGGRKWLVIQKQNVHAHIHVQGMANAANA